MATPLMAIRTPAVLRVLKGSIPSSAPTTMVIIGRVERASVPRATVVRLSATL